MSSSRHLAPVLTADGELIRFWECSRCQWRHIPTHHQRPQDAVSAILAKAAFNEHCCDDFEPRKTRRRERGFLSRLKALARDLSII